MFVIDPYLNNCCCGTTTTTTTSIPTSTSSTTSPPLFWPQGCPHPFTYDFETATGWYIGFDIELPPIYSVGLPKRRVYLRGHIPACTVVMRYHSSECCRDYVSQRLECPPYAIDCCWYNLPPELFPCPYQWTQHVLGRLSRAKPPLEAWYKENITGGNFVLLYRKSYEEFQCAYETIFCCNDAIEQMYSEWGGFRCTNFSSHRVVSFINIELYWPFTGPYIKTYSPTIPPVGGIQIPFFVVLSVYHAFWARAVCVPRLFPDEYYRTLNTAHAGCALHYGVLDLPFFTSREIQLQLLDFVNRERELPIMHRVFPELTKFVTDTKIKLVFESISQVAPVVWQVVNRYTENPPFFISY